MCKLFFSIKYSVSFLNKSARGNNTRRSIAVSVSEQKRGKAEKRAKTEHRRERAKYLNGGKKRRRYQREVELKERLKERWEAAKNTSKPENRGIIKKERKTKHWSKNCLSVLYAYPFTYKITTISQFESSASQLKSDRHLQNRQKSRPTTHLYKHSKEKERIENNTE